MNEKRYEKRTSTGRYERRRASGTDEAETLVVNVDFLVCLDCGCVVADRAAHSLACTQRPTTTKEDH